MLNEIEKRIIKSVVARLKQERVRINMSNELRDAIIESEIDLHQLVNPNHKEINRNSEDVLRWIRVHDALKISDIANYIGISTGFLRNIINKVHNKNGKPHKLPDKYLDKLIEFCSDYGYK